MPIGRSRRRALAGAAIISSRSSKRAAAAVPTPAAAPAAPAPETDDMFIQLEKLGALRDKGVLTDAEFDAKKKQILGL